MSRLRYVRCKNPRYEIDVDFSTIVVPDVMPKLRNAGGSKVLHRARRITNKYLGLCGSPSNVEIVDLLGLTSSKKKAFYMVILAADAIRKALPGRYMVGWAKKRKYVFERDGGICAYCHDKSESPHCDHIHPWSLGGSDEIDNLVTACAPCNLKKKDRVLSPLELAAVMEFIVTGGAGIQSRPHNNARQQAEQR